MKIITLGLGYIGLPTAIMFAKQGVDVVGVDIIPDVIDQLNRGQVHLEEPGIQEGLQEVLRKQTFKASLYPEKGDAFIIAVPTPNNNDLYKSCDLKYVEAAVKSILPYLAQGNTIVIESTISPRTTENVIQPFLEKQGWVIGKDLSLVHCPERVLPGKILHELTYNNRIIGGVTPSCTEKGKALYRLFVKGELISSTVRAAELSKLMENTYRDVNIALANELVKIGDKLGIDALEVISMANKHPRVNIHQPGPGVGGHCLAVDPYFIVAAAPKETPLIQEARKINSSMPSYTIEKIHQLMEKIRGKRLTILGLAYKGDTDDLRESPAVHIMEELKKQGQYQISVYDPYVKAAFIETGLQVALEKSDLALVLCDHREFKHIPAVAIAGMNQTVLLDARNIVENKEYFEQAFSFGNLFEIQQESPQHTM
ncbi:nucleotide sugar dehydrogenase [Listeria ilorinensis]|uniref:nucleotide sugar dehydrogenase n=1 Tax=Listeria ilorinensis TaxID=2867439 RepID=UPI001EF705C6|nr:nucleotide sugar dehydrogenase [Listeria ilorinensis]